MFHLVFKHNDSVIRPFWQVGKAGANLLLFAVALVIQVEAQGGCAKHHRESENISRCHCYFSLLKNQSQNHGSPKCR